MDRHAKEACTARLQACPKWSEMVRIDGLDKHAKEEGSERDVHCNLEYYSCSWELVDPLYLCLT